mgnify:CR=1 FL=1
MAFDDAVADRQPEPEALADRLGREERVEQLPERFGRDAGAVVGDDEARTPRGRVGLQVGGSPVPMDCLVIMHRDVRAANVLVSGRDPIHVVITDFGVSHQLSAV